MNKALVVIFLVLIGFGALFVWQDKSGKRLLGPSAIEIQKKERPLDRYTIDALSKTKFEASEISLGEVLTDTSGLTSYKQSFSTNKQSFSTNKQSFSSNRFYFYVEGNPSTGSGLKKVSGLVNVPKADGIYPVVLMFRGWVDREAYKTGVGTQRAGEVFAKNGFITLAPDFLGYGESDNPSESPIEERFQTYLTALTLLASIKNLNDALSSLCHSDPESEFRTEEILNPFGITQGKQVQDDRNCVSADTDKIGIWGHSNGGQISLAILEITGRAYPTVLWAPVSKPFPYSILYYTDEFDDRGKMLRRVVAEFEKDYDVELYNLTNYFDRINAPLVVHQGTADDAVPIKWSNQLVEELEKMEKDVDYFTYSGADHNLLPGGWNLAVARSIEFWRENL